jgi:hypothetical protein
MDPRLKYQSRQAMIDAQSNMSCAIYGHRILRTGMPWQADPWLPACMCGVKLALHEYDIWWPLSLLPPHQKTVVCTTQSLAQENKPLNCPIIIARCLGWLLAKCTLTAISREVNKACGCTPPLPIPTRQGNLQVRSVLHSREKEVSVW